MSSDNLKHRLKDPRYFQIATLSLLLSFGIVALDFGVSWLQATAIFATALAVQFAAGRLAGLTRFDPLSAVITSLSLTLLLRTDALGIAVVAAALAIASKFLIRFRGKHIFNPANFALVLTTVCSSHAWISTGQWGSAAIGALLFACLGYLVLSRARRAETTISFLLAFAVLIFGRALWLGDPMAIALHQMQNGALLLFAFFMISDPMTTPNAVSGRVFYGALVALLAFYIQFFLYTPGGPILALIITAPLVPLIDIVAKGSLYRWAVPRENPQRIPEGEIR